MLEIVHSTSSLMLVNFKGMILPLTPDEYRSLVEDIAELADWLRLFLSRVYACVYAALSLKHSAYSIRPTSFLFSFLLGKGRFFLLFLFGWGEVYLPLLHFPPLPFFPDQHHSPYFFSFFRGSLFHFNFRWFLPLHPIFLTFNSFFFSLFMKKERDFGIYILYIPQKRKKEGILQNCYNRRKINKYGSWYLLLPYKQKIRRWS